MCNKFVFLLLRSIYYAYPFEYYSMEVFTVGSFYAYRLQQVISGILVCVMVSPENHNIQVCFSRHAKGFVRIVHPCDIDSIKVFFIYFLCLIFRTSIVSVYYPQVRGGANPSKPTRLFANIGLTKITVYGTSKQSRAISSAGRATDS